MNVKKEQKKLNFSQITDRKDQSISIAVFDSILQYSMNNASVKIVLEKKYNSIAAIFTAFRKHVNQFVPTQNY